MMRFLVVLWALTGAVMAQALPTNPPPAASSAQLRAFGDTLMMDRTLALMQREAAQSAAEMSADMFAGQDPAIWADAVRGVFDPSRARTQFDQGLAQAHLPPADLARAQDFFSSDLGARILTLELSAREAMLDPAIKDAAQQAWATAQLTAKPEGKLRIARLETVIIANDLIESNVMAALNSNLAYYQGMNTAGALGDAAQSDILAEVWAQESQLRSDTKDWLYPFLNLAYQPLSIADLDTYIAFSESDTGRTVNAALFAAFDALGVYQSRGMGLAAGNLMAGQDI